MLKNISSQIKGRKSELKALHYYQRQSFRLYKKNYQLTGIEIDLLLHGPHWLMVEVKTLRHHDDLAFRLTEKQKKRLLRARSIFESQVDQAVELRVLFVLPNDFIELPIDAFL